MSHLGCTGEHMGLKRSMLWRHAMKSRKMSQRLGPTRAARRARQVSQAIMEWVTEHEDQRVLSGRSGRSAAPESSVLAMALRFGVESGKKDTLAKLVLIHATDTSEAEAGCSSHQT
ncbi:hypothetical protein VTK26DRAFT_1639 [Humicola hyalothermophila]